MLALAALVLAASGLAVVVPASAGAAPGSFLVNHPDDETDLVLDGTCETASGTCSLRAAVQEAIHRGGASEITFASGANTVGLSLGGNGDVEVGDLDIPAGVSIALIGDPTGPNDTLVKGDQLGDRHLHVHPGGRLELRDVALAGATATGDGGAILNEGEVLVTSSPASSGEFVALFGNHATGVGGAVANRPGATLDVRNVSTDPGGSRVDLRYNTADGGGGAISNDGGTVRIEGRTGPGGSHDVYLDDNAATSADGGGVRNASGVVTLGCRAFVRHSDAVDGGGLWNAGTLRLVGGGAPPPPPPHGGGVFNAASGVLEVVDAGPCGPASQLDASRATGTGGALHNEGAVTVEDGARLLITGAGGGPDAQTGGGIHQGGGTFQVDGEVVISQTVAALDGGGVSVAGGTLQVGDVGRITVRAARGDRDGGALFASGGLVSARVALHGSSAGNLGGAVAVTSGGNVGLRDSVFADNQAPQGGAIANSGQTSVLNSTFGDNVASTMGGAVAHLGGALQLRHVTVVANSPDGVAASPAAASTLALQRSLLARNQGTDCGGAARSGGDFNVFDDPSCVPTGSDLTDGSRFADVGAQLEPMSIGDTDSYGLLPGNPAIDHVTDGGCGTPDRDQRGALRPVDGDGLDGAACDAGAVEAGAASPPRSISGTVRDEVTGAPMAGVCIFAGAVGGTGDGAMARTGPDGTFTSSVVDGEYLMAFFVPVGDPSTPDDCGEQGVDLDVRPEWYRNVPVQLEDDDPQGDVVFPDLDDVTLVEVAGVDLTGIDACLGAGPGAGRDAPCAPSATAAPGDPAPSLDPRPPAPDTAPTGAERPSVAAGATFPARLAFAGVSSVGVLLLGAVTVAIGVGFTVVGRRRRRRLVPIRVQDRRYPRG